ncbi:SRPBCC domain-containing protein [Gemmatimonas sp.]|uniref:SRPBCC family protein n=1 Tax=Gemmatimonas sp. TaxID=1962908 RepID=UPI00286CA11F|nr:SRPBCC domain-containing protein [Gemmatimonas sp.]
MIAVASPLDDLTLDITQDTHVRASIEDTFAALLEELGPNNKGMADAPMPMVLEAHPGGRWYRDLGGNNGHCWGMVQAIRSPTLLEISGPLMMSFAVASNVQYRLRVQGDETVITLRHTALGLFPEGYRDNLTLGWAAMTRRVQARFATTS